MVTMPLQDMRSAAANVARVGRAAGAQQAISGLANQALARRMVPGSVAAPGAAAPPAVAPGRVPAMKKGGKFIQSMGLKKGALHRQLGIPEDQPIPAARLEQAAHSKNPLLAKRARTAKMIKGLPRHHGPRKG